jgi:hypothetical protein
VVGGWRGGGEPPPPGLVTEAVGVVDHRGSRERRKKVLMGLSELIGRLLIYLPEGR